MKIYNLTAFAALAPALVRKPFSGAAHKLCRKVNFPPLLVMLHFAAAISIFMLCWTLICERCWRSSFLLALWVTKLDTRCDSSFCPKLLQANCSETGSNGAVHSRTWWFRNGADEIYDTWSAWRQDMDWRWRKIHLNQAGVANDSIVAARLVRHRPVKPSNQFKTRNNGEMVAGVSDSLCS